MEKSLKPLFAAAIVTGLTTAHADAAVILFQDDFSTNTLAGDYLSQTVSYNATAETVTIARDGAGNFLEIDETFALDTGGSTELTIAFDYAFGASMFGSSFNVQFSDNGGSSWIQLANIPRTGTGENDSGNATNPYSITLAEGDYTFSDQVRVRLIESSNSGNKGYNIDNLSVSVDTFVPEPGSLALLGLGGLCLLRRRRQA